MTFDVDAFLDRHVGDESLAHYASPYYNPQKAREYYLRTRELKGRQSTEGFSDKQREALTITKDSIRTAKTNDLKSAQEQQKQSMDELRGNAKATRERIQEKLKQLRDKLTGESDKLRQEREKLRAEKPEPIVLPIPTNASPKLRAFLERQQQQANSRQNAEYAKKVQDFTEKARASSKASSAEREAASKEASATLKSNAESLKSSIQSAREGYVAKKKEIVAKYEATTESEYNNIRTQVR